MLSNICLPKFTSSIPSTSGGLKAPVTKACKHKEDEYTRAHGNCGAHITGISLDPVSKTNKRRGSMLGLC